MNDYIVDVVLLLLFAGITLIYSKRGFVKTILSSLSWVIAIALARFLSEPTVQFIREKTSLLNGIGGGIDKAIVVVFLFFVLFMLIKIITRLIDRLFKLPVLKQVNKILGVVLGMVCAIVAVIIISLLLHISSSVVYDADYVEAVSNSKIVSFIVNNQFLFDKLNFIN